MVSRFFGLLIVATTTICILSATPDGLDYVISHELDKLRHARSNALEQQSIEYLEKRYKQIKQISVAAGIVAVFVTNRITKAYCIRPRLRFVTSTLIGLSVAPYVWAHSINNLYSEELPLCMAEQLKMYQNKKPRL